MLKNIKNFIFRSPKKLKNEIVAIPEDKLFQVYVSDHDFSMHDGVNISFFDDVSVANRVPEFKISIKFTVEKKIKKDAITIVILPKDFYKFEFHESHEKIIFHEYKLLTNYGKLTNIFFFRFDSEKEFLKFKLKNNIVKL